MATQPIVVSQGDVQGNIGQCQVNVSQIQIDWYHERSIGVNSCTGQVVADYSYINGLGAAGAIFNFVFSAGGAVVCLIMLLAFGIGILAKIFRW